jgi:hypothetical protein
LLLDFLATYFPVRRQGFRARARKFERREFFKPQLTHELMMGEK